MGSVSIPDEQPRQALLVRWLNELPDYVILRNEKDLFENLAKGAAEARNDVTQVQAIVVGNQSRRHFRRAKYATCILLKAAARSRHRRKVFPRHGGRPEEGVIVGAADRLDPAVLVEPGRVL